MDAGEKGVIEIIECNQDDHAGFRGKRGNDAQHLDLAVQVKRRGLFIRQQHFGLARKRLCQRH